MRGTHDALFLFARDGHHSFWHFFRGMCRVFIASSEGGESGEAHSCSQSSRDLPPNSARAGLPYLAGTKITRPLKCSSSGVTQGSKVICILRYARMGNIVTKKTLYPRFSQRCFTIWVIISTISWVGYKYCTRTTLVHQCGRGKPKIVCQLDVLIPKSEHSSYRHK